MSRLDKIYLGILALLVLVACFGVYHLIFLADSWGERAVVFFVYAISINIVFMVATFSMAGMANHQALSKRRALKDQEQADVDGKSNQVDDSENRNED